MHTEELSIEALAYGGDGVAHLGDGRVAFVAGGVPGDVVRASYVDAGKRFVNATIEELLQASGHRVEAPCALAQARRCGGCPWACLAYEQQLVHKRRFVVDALERIAKLPAQRVGQLVGECVPSKRQWNYRNKVEFEVGQDVAGRLALGMHAQGGAFVPLAACELCAPKLVNAPKALTGSLRYVAGTQDLGLQRVGLRHSLRTGSTEVAIWTAPGRFPRASAAKVVPQSMPAKGIGVTRVLLKGDAKRRKVVGTESLAGRGFWAEQVAGHSYALSAPSFFQVNTPGAERLVELVLAGLQPDGLDFVADLYCGAGTFTLPLAAAAGHVAAVEMEGSSVRDLRRNLEHAGLIAEVIGGDVARELEGLGPLDKAVVDPPRSGLGEAAVKALAAAGPARIAYVSCNPTTLARDVAALQQAGYVLQQATPVDLFPQAYHVECVALLQHA